MASDSLLVARPTDPRAPASASAVVGAPAAPTFPRGLRQPRAGRARARARAGLVGKSSLEAAECQGQRVHWTSAKASKALELPERKKTPERKEEKPVPLKPWFPINSLGSFRSTAEAQLAEAVARTRTCTDAFSTFGRREVKGLAGKSCTCSGNLQREVGGKYCCGAGAGRGEEEGDRRGTRGRGQGTN